MFGYKPYQLALRSIIAISFFWWMASFIGIMLKTFGIAFHHMTHGELLGSLFGTFCVACLAGLALAMFDDFDT